MPYITEPDRVYQAITDYARAKILWLDTEIADFQSNKPRLSLVQILDDRADRNGDRVTILDLLDRNELIDELIDKIMANPAIEKVFHNASYDCRFLGKTKAQNVTCTLVMAQQIPYYILPLSNYKLATLAQQLCNFDRIDKTLQSSDWSLRPLTESQVDYAKMDAVYVACVHERLIELSARSQIDPASDDIATLTNRYRNIEHRWKALDTELKHLKERLKQAMSVQNIAEVDGFKLSIQERKYKQVKFDDLAKFTRSSGIEINFPIRLTQELQKQMKEIVENIPVEEAIEKVLQLKISEVEDEDLPF